MPNLCISTRLYTPQVAVALMVLVSGCGTGSLSEYHAVEQTKAKSIPSGHVVLGGDSTLAVADAMQVENAAMMSIRPEASVGDQDFAVSALKVANPRKVELLVPQKTFSRDRKTGAIRLTYDDLNLLKVINMDPVTDDAVSRMPDWMTSLEGQMVRVRGYMNPTFQAEDLEGFVLLRDNKECCFGPGAKIYDHIQIKLKDGLTTRYVSLHESLDVVGRFKIDLYAAGESIIQLYIIEDAAVIGR